MPPERTIACPSCNAERVTKAGAGTRIACRGCKKQFKAPAAAAGGGDETRELGRHAAVDEVETVGGVKVRRATATKVRQTARPRASKAGDATPSTRSGPAAPPADDGTHQVEVMAPVETRAQVLGRRGGRGYYERRVRGGRR